MKKKSKKQRKAEKQRWLIKRRGDEKRTAAMSEGRPGMPMKGILIKGWHVFRPMMISEAFLSAACANPEGSPGQIIFRPKATKQLQKFIDWGRGTERNTIEQQGILLGSIYQTPTGYSAVVEAVLLSEATGNRVYVESTHSQWSKMDNQMDELNVGRERKLMKLGWWHTHPNMPIFMSGTDRETQSLYFCKDWQFAVVLNPQAKTWGAFIGEQAVSCEGYFMNSNIHKLKKLEENTRLRQKRERSK